MEWTQCHDFELNFSGGVGGESAHPLHPSFAFFFVFVLIFLILTSIVDKLDMPTPHPPPLNQILLQLLILLPLLHDSLKMYSSTTPL